MTTMEVLEVDLAAAQLKAAEAVQTGMRTLDFYAAAFSDKPDTYGHIIEPTAFDTWLKAFYAKGQALKISFNHSAVLDPLDPTNTIGYALADPQHVFVDSYGLRVKAFIDVTTEKGKAVEWQIEKGLLKGASLALIVDDNGLKREGKVTRITMVKNVREAGPVPNPANQDAVLLWLKSEGMLDHPTDQPYMTVDEFRQILLKAVDDTAWDGNRAMGMCNSAADFESICAGVHGAGDPGERQHYALPHHYLGKGPNAQGVASALGRFNQTQDLSNKQAALRHLLAHRAEIQRANKSEEDDVTVTDDEVTPDSNEQVLIKESNPEDIQAMHDALHEAGAVCAVEETVEETKSEEDSRLEEAERFVETPDTTGMSPEAADRARRLRLLETSLP